MPTPSGSSRRRVRAERAWRRRRCSRFAMGYRRSRSSLARSAGDGERASSVIRSSSTASSRELDTESAGRAAARNRGPELRAPHFSAATTTAAARYATAAGGVAVRRHARSRRRSTGSHCSARMRTGARRSRGAGFPFAPPGPVRSAGVTRAHLRTSATSSRRSRTSRKSSMCQCASRRDSRVRAERTEKDRNALPFITGLGSSPGNGGVR